jgi:TRAP-type C4-dicarboxylate transport system permease small subunit
LFQRIVNKISKFIGFIGAGTLVVLMLITGIDVFGRYVLHKPLLGAFEISELALALVIVLGWGYTQSVKGHIDIDLLYSRLPLTVQTFLDFLIPLLGLCLFSFISWQAIIFVSDSLGWHETTEMMGIPVWIFKLMIFVGAISICLQFIADIVTAFHKLKERA